MSSVSSDEDKAPARPRQKPGLACEECRRRKLRCDRGKPRCEACADSNLNCFTTMSRPPRGPKKGHLKALQARIGESKLDFFEVSQLLTSLIAALETNMVERQTIGFPGGTSCNIAMENTFPEDPNITEQRQWSSSTSMPSLNSKARDSTVVYSPKSAASPADVELPEMLCADLCVFTFAAIYHCHRD